MDVIQEFIERSNRCDAIPELVALFEAAIRNLGLDSFAYGQVHAGSKPQPTPPPFLASCYPKDWLKHYAARGYGADDPTYRSVAARRGPVAWNEFDKALPISRRERTVMDEAAEAGLRTGVSIPLHGPNGEVFGISVTGSNGREEFTLAELSLLFLLGQQFHLSYKMIGELPDSSRPIRLSDRQREILQWAAVGKSRGEIASILGIGEDGVDHHFRQVFRKFDCHDRTVAVLTAARMGLICV